jgi:hypothetical protein
MLYGVTKGIKVMYFVRIFTPRQDIEMKQNKA